MKQWYLVIIIRQHSNMPIMLAPSFCTARPFEVKGLEQRTVNAVEMQSAAHGCANMNVDV